MDDIEAIDDEEQQEAKQLALALSLIDRLGPEEAAEHFPDVMALTATEVMAWPA